MPPLLRLILAPIAGILVAVLLISVMERIGQGIFPRPANLDFRDPETVRAYVATLPTSAFLWILSGWLVGVAGGIVVGALIGRAHVARLASVVGGIVLAATIANLVLIHHPMWFAVLAIIAIPGVAFGTYHFAKRFERREVN